MAIEGVTRGFGGPEYESFRNKVLDLLEVQLGALGHRPPA
jgi:hypothetical protein